VYLYLSCILGGEEMVGHPPSNAETEENDVANTS